MLDTFFQICGRVALLVRSSYATRRVPQRRLDWRATADHVGQLPPTSVPGGRRRSTGARYLQQLAYSARHQSHSREYSLL